jgi:pyruvate/2-oxoglutarate dehydrogenase complex dihydrolipoamide acyltransferase (E2) component
MEKIVIMAFGAVIALAGLVMLFRGRGQEGRNVVKILGAEFDLSNSAVVVFLAGVAIFVAPLFLSQYLPSNVPSPSAPPAAPSEIPGPTPTPQQPTTSPAPAPQEPAATAPAPQAPASPAAKPPAPQDTDIGEVEPNGGFETATPIRMGTVMHGQLTKDDVDFFKFRTSTSYKHNVHVKLEIENKDAQLTLRVYDFEKKAEIDKFILGDLVTKVDFLANPSADYVIQLENRPNWNSTAYTLTLTEN